MHKTHSTACEQHGHQLRVLKEYLEKEKRWKNCRQDTTNTGRRDSVFVRSAQTIRHDDVTHWTNRS